MQSGTRSSPLLVHRLKYAALGVTVVGVLLLVYWISPDSFLPFQGSAVLPKFLWGHRQQDNADASGVDNVTTVAVAGASRRVVSVDQARRQTVLRAACQRHRGNPPHPPSPPHFTTWKKSRHFNRMLVDDQRKVIYCYIPKTGSSTWKGYLLRTSAAADFADDTDWASIGVHSKGLLARHGLRVLASYTAGEAAQRLEAYFKFLVVRHPLDRLVSAYQDKMVFHKSYKRKLKRHIITMYRHDGMGTASGVSGRLGESSYRAGLLARLKAHKWRQHHHSDNHHQHRRRRRRRRWAEFSEPTRREDAIPDMDILPDRPHVREFVPRSNHMAGARNATTGVAEEEEEGDHVTFQEFISYLLHEDPGRKDQHWTTYDRLCQPCLIHYDYVAKAESMGADFREILRHMETTKENAHGLDRLGALRALRNQGLGGAKSEPGEAARTENVCNDSRKLSVFHNISDSDVNSLMTIYKVDMSLFGYSWDADSYTASCVDKAVDGVSCC